MPNKDGTGPNGKGPKTGRGMGKCGTNSNDLELKDASDYCDGKGTGRGQGRGRCCGRGQKGNND
ncbi:hypothetical protein EOM39_06190 [Candidatus Gracilibacteria bacterium]|nr:hypothetical protein [Candidatus Gracilibacteria bacterium]